MNLDNIHSLNDGMVFVNIPPATEATLQNEYPFTINISASNVDDHYITLYSQYSRSRPYQKPQSKWGHLIPQWRFVDLDGNIIDKIKTTDTIIYDDNGNVLGITGVAQFYYIDDLPTLTYDTPVMLWATLEVSGRPVSYDYNGIELPSYSNSKIIKGEPYYINGQQPSYLDITQNGLMDIADVKWINTPFRYTILAKSSLSGECNSRGDITVFDYPQPNSDVFASTNNINRTLLNIPTSSQEFLDTNVYFVREDINGFKTGGYNIGSVESSAVGITQISAIVNVELWDIYRDYPYVWIPNPYYKTLNRVDLPYNFGRYYNPLLPNINTYSYGISGVGSQYTTISGVSGLEYWSGDSLTFDEFAGLYGLGVAGECFDVIWGVDPELDLLYKFDTLGNIICSVNIEPSGSSPQSIAIDSNKNLWVTLYGATSTIKFDSYGVLTTSVAIPPYEITDVFSITSSDPDSILVRPVQVDTDTNDNIWVTYEHPSSSLLLKYDTYGEFITSCVLPISSQPYGVIIDSDDNSVWVSNAYEMIVDPYSWQYSASAGNIQHYTSDGVLISTYDNIPHPTYLTLDRNKNLWFIFGTSSFGVISGDTITKYYATTGNVELYNDYHASIDNVTVENNSNFKGIACDIKNRVWCLNSNENTAYIINPENTSQYTLAVISPQDTTYYDHSIQGLGDWTGLQWNDKYVTSIYPITATLSGVSNEFEIKDFNDDVEIRKFNESWDASTQIHDYALSEHIYNKTNLFDTYIKAMVGSVSATDGLGLKSYERIANFVDNHVDIDTCGIDQLYSIANELDVPMDEYIFNIPSSLKRLIDIISISHQKLWGTRCKCNKNFDPKLVCTNCGHDHCLNRSKTEFDINTYNISGGDYVVIKPKFGSGYYDLLKTPTTVISGVSTVSVYPISATSSIEWLLSSYYNQYYFYDYIPDYCEVQIEGVINWDDTYTTLSETNSSLSSWYDVNGIVDTILTYDLYNGLKFNRE